MTPSPLASPADLLGLPPQSVAIVGPPPTPTPSHEIVAALRNIGVLDGLTDHEYLWFAQQGTERVGEDGALVFREREPAVALNLILRGEVHVRRRHTGPVSLWIGRAGQMTGKLPFSRMKTYGGDGFTVGPAWTIDIHQDLFPAMLAAIPSMAQRCVSVMLDRVREVTRMEQQAEKLAALGKLAANLAHELNNPASAAQRFATSLQPELRSYGAHRYALGALCLGPEHAAALKLWIETVRNQGAAYGFGPNPVLNDALATADREEYIGKWLEQHHVPDTWKIAPTLAETNIPFSLFDDFAERFPPETIAPAFTTFASALRVERMTATIVDSTARIFDIISAIKDYSYMDQAPIQELDLAATLENTLAIMTSRLKRVKVVLDFDPDMPHIRAYGSELNQVWNELLQNALDAMQPQPGADPQGTLKLTTKLAGQMALIEIWDTGPGIPPELSSRIFEPFFTTRAPGSGLGLGLDTAHRIVSKHSGFLTVQSKPGETCFQVRLPLDQMQAY